jgi:hypothetical protein
MKNEEKKTIPHHPLVTRRDFLAQGLVALSATMVLPSAFGRALQGAALECGGSNVSAMTPFMVFDMAGGGALPGNFLVGKNGGPEDLLRSYDKLGWDPRESGALNNDFGLPMSAKYSKILTGILANSSAAARSRLRMGSICHFSQDDTSGNKMNAASLIIRAGFVGTSVANGIGMLDSISGGNSAPVVANLAFKPAIVNSINDILGATNFGGQAFKEVEMEKKRALVEGSIDLSSIQKNDYMGSTDGQILAELSECAYQKSLSFLEAATGLDPRADSLAQSVYQINQNTAVTDRTALSAALSMNTLSGASGPSVLTIGGFDYHGSTQESSDAKDLEFGNELGRAIELAFRMEKPFFFQILTDGGVEGTPGTRRWSSDSGDKGMTILGYYSPKAPPKMLRNQVGFYTDGQGAERTTLIGSEPALVGYAVLANYLNIHGKLDMFKDLAPGVFSSNAQLKSVLLFDVQN